MNGYDMRELTRFQKELLQLARAQMPKESKDFLRKEGNKLKKLTLNTAKSRVKKKKGNYFKGIRRGKVYIYHGNGGLSIRVFGGKPGYHSGILEEGHRIVRNGEEVGFVEGKHVFSDSAKAFEPEFYGDVQRFIDTTLNKGLR